MTELLYYQNYKGPNLSKATLNNDDITERIKNIYGKDNNWQGKLGISGDGNGYGYTQEQLENFPEIDMNTLLEYYQAVRTNIFEYIDGLTQADLDRDLGMNRKAPFDTVGNLLSHLVIEEAEHAGQVRYLRGMQRGLNK